MIKEQVFCMTSIGLIVLSCNVLSFGELKIVGVGALVGVGVMGALVGAANRLAKKLKIAPKNDGDCCGAFVCSAKTTFLLLEASLPARSFGWQVSVAKRRYV